MPEGGDFFWLSLRWMADAYFVRESTLDVIADTAVPINRL
jgi:hypothetical protein